MKKTAQSNLSKLNKPIEDGVVFAVGPTVRGGSVYKEFEPEIDGVVMARISGFGPFTQTDIDAVPRVLRIDPPKSGAVPEIIGWNTGPYIVVPQFRDWLEELEPGRHRYIPISVRSDSSIKGKKEHDTYYLIIAPPVIEAVKFEETLFGAGGGGGGGYGRAGYEASSGFLSSHPNAPWVIDRKAIEGHHFWRLPNGRGWQQMCSPELWSAFANTNFAV
jgi:hypothetical protein